MKRAALYLRSSKDRKDVSPDAQRRALQELARSRSEVIVTEFVDRVESGKDENRPGFRELVKAVRNPKRGWESLLLYDTARLSRRRVISVIFEEVDCKPNGVQVVYRSLPDLDPMTEVLLKSVVQAMDEYHSLSSREKGLAGMAENVRQGWRAGGRAPLGYRLHHVKTGAMRDGNPVTKSKLELDTLLAPKMADFLRLRATGLSRAQARSEARLDDVSDNTLLGIEWNALTYAGHTVWNVHHDRARSATAGKRRPRSEWVIQRDTHPALVTDVEAERLLKRLEERSAALRAHQPLHRYRESSALLGGRLFAPDGRKWWAEADRYRLPGKHGASIARGQLDEPVLDCVLAQLASPTFAQVLLRGTRDALAKEANPAAAAELRTRIARLDKQAARMLEMAALMDEPAPALRHIEELEAQRAALDADLAGYARASADVDALGTVTIDCVQRELSAIGELASEGDQAASAAVMALVDRIELDPASFEANIHFKLAPGASSTPGAAPVVNVASPRPSSFGLRPMLRGSVRIRVVRKRDRPSRRA